MRTFHFWILFAGIAAMIVLTFAIRALLYRNYCKKICKKGTASFVLEGILCFLSLDYLLAKLSKEKIEKNSLHKEKVKVESQEPEPPEQAKAAQPEKEDSEQTKTAQPENEDSKQAKAERSKYIKAANALNLLISFLLCVCIFLLKSFFSSEWPCWLLLGMIAFRALSRTVEINVSFFKDCVSAEEKQSDLSKYERIGLAFKSLLEEALLFAGIYVFFPGQNPPFWNAMLGGLHSFILSPVSYKTNFQGLFSFVAIYQTICSIILITISFATYISASGEKKSK